MCGIFATTERRRWAGRVDAVLDALSRRGPDGAGSTLAERGPDEPLLAHTRLAVIGLGAPGTQPATSRDGAVDLTFNGELYDYAQTARRLGIDAGGSDTRVLVELLARGEDAALGGLRGMWAFVAWDRRTSTLTAMRDPAGIKPLYLLRHPGGGVSFSSELPALLLDPDARRLDELGLGQFLALGHTGPSLTCFSGVTKLTPGVVHRWRREDDRWLASTWTPPRAVRPALPVADAVADSVAAHLVADVPVGVFLSGGVDSTLLAAHAARRAPGLHCFTVTFPEAPQLDEGRRAAANAALLGARHTTVPATLADLAACADAVVRQHGEPFGDAAVLPLTHLARAASPEVKVVLTGEGADEVFGGYVRYDVQRRLAPLRGHRPLPGRVAAAWGRRRSGAGWQRGVEAALHGGGPDAHAALLDGELATLTRVRPDLAVDVRALLHTRWDAEERPRTAGRLPGQGYDRTTWLPNVYLEKADRATMSTGLEARVPFLDPVVDAAAAATRAARAGKAPLRAALLDLLPDVDLPTRKLGLAVDVRGTVTAHLTAQLRHECEDPTSVLHRLAGGTGARRLAERAERSPTLRFRLAVLGLWEQVHDGGSFS